MASNRRKLIRYLEDREYFATLPSTASDSWAFSEYPVVLGPSKFPDRDEDSKPCGYIATPKIATTTGPGSAGLHIGVRCFVRSRFHKGERFLESSMTIGCETDSEYAYNGVEVESEDDSLSIRTWPRSQVTLISKADEVGEEARFRLDSFMADLVTIFAEDGTRLIGFTPVPWGNPQYSKPADVTTYHQLMGTVNPCKVQRMTSDTGAGKGSVDKGNEKTIEGYCLLNGREGGQGREHELDDDGVYMKRPRRSTHPKDWHQYVQTLETDKHGVIQIQLISLETLGDRESKPDEGVISYYWRKVDDADDTVTRHPNGPLSADLWKDASINDLADD